MLRCLLLLLLFLLTSPAWGDEINLRLSGTWNPIFPQEEVSPNGGLAYAGDYFQIFGSTGATKSGSGTISNPFLYRPSHWYLILDSHKDNVICDSYCSDWDMLSMAVYYADPDTLILSGTFVALFSPAFYFYVGLPEGPPAGSGSISVLLHGVEVNNFSPIWLVDSQYSSAQLYPVPEARHPCADRIGYCGGSLSAQGTPQLVTADATGAPSDIIDIAVICTAGPASVSPGRVTHKAQRPNSKRIAAKICARGSS